MSKKTVVENAVAPVEKKAPEFQVFEGTIAGHKFLFRADRPVLETVTEVLPGQSAMELALANSAELVARAKANHDAVKALYKAWLADKKAQKNSSPEAIAAKAEKDAVKARAKADRAAVREAAKIEKAKARIEAKAEALRLKAASLTQTASEMKAA